MKRRGGVIHCGTRDSFKQRALSVLVVCVSVRGNYARIYPGSYWKANAYKVWHIQPMQSQCIFDRPPILCGVLRTGPLVSNNILSTCAIRKYWVSKLVISYII